MNTHSDKAQKNKSHAIENSLAKQQSSGENTFHFIDNRPEAAVQRKLIELVNDSRQVNQFNAFHEQTNNYSDQKNETIQQKANKTWLPDKSTGTIAQLKFAEKITNQNEIAYAPSITNAEDTLAGDGVIQRYKTSGGANLGMEVGGVRLFFNSHVTTPDAGENFNIHCTTQVNVNEVYRGSIRTYNNGINGLHTFIDPALIAALTPDQLSWAQDTHDTYVQQHFP